MQVNAGFFLGTDDFRKQNWEGLVEKVCARLSRWKWLLPQLSYRGRVLICNNLVASSLWHKIMILEPPKDLVERIQKQMVDFFWSGQHWLRAPVLYLPIHEGRQGLVDIGTACALLRRAGSMGLDRHLFLMNINTLDLTSLTSFYRSVLRAWSHFKFSRGSDGVQGYF